MSVGRHMLIAQKQYYSEGKEKQRTAAHYASMLRMLNIYPINNVRRASVHAHLEDVEGICHGAPVVEQALDNLRTQREFEYVIRCYVQYISDVVIYRM
jgi:hypothetical protein